MDLLGPSLEDLFDRCSRHFSVSTVCDISIQLVSSRKDVMFRLIVFKASTSAASSTETSNPTIS